jgi:hypothetical protein
LARRRGGADDETAADAESGGGAAWSGVISPGPEQRRRDEAGLTCGGECKILGWRSGGDFFQDWARSEAGLSMQCVQGGTPTVAFQSQIKMICKIFGPNLNL